MHQNHKILMLINLLKLPKILNHVKLIGSEDQKKKTEKQKNEMRSKYNNGRFVL